MGLNTFWELLNNSLFIVSCAWDATLWDSDTSDLMRSINKVEAQMRLGFAVRCGVISTVNHLLREFLMTNVRVDKGIGWWVMGICYWHDKLLMVSIKCVCYSRGFGMIFVAIYCYCLEFSGYWLFNQECFWLDPFIWYPVSSCYWMFPVFRQKPLKN